MTVIIDFFLHSDEHETAWFIIDSVIGVAGVILAIAFR